MRTRIKFCGCTSVTDAQAAVRLGVDALGVIFAPASPRCIDASLAFAIARAVPPFVTLVAVFVDPNVADVQSARSHGFIPQFSGNEPATVCESVTGEGPYLKVVHFDPAGNGPAAGGFERYADGYVRAAWMFDTAVDGKHGGTGATFRWESARELAGERPITISGGLRPENVADCIRRVRPYAVDVRSGIETHGVKDFAKMSAFVRAVKDADAQT